MPDTTRATSTPELTVAAMVRPHEGQYAHFESADADKRTHIIQVALEEFANHDYAQVSTNEIVKKAGISKGLLFHYFGNKAGLYRYLQQSFVELAANAVLEHTDLSGGDVFDVLCETTEIKLSIAAEYPVEARFYTRSLIDSSVPSEIRANSNITVDAAFSAMEQIIQGIDESLLKEGLEKQKVAKIIDLVCTGITNEVIADMSPEAGTEYWQEQTEYVKTYFDFMRQLFYKDAQEGDSQ